MPSMLTNQELGIPDDAAHEERADALAEAVRKHHEQMFGKGRTSTPRDNEVVLTLLGLEDKPREGRMN